MGIFCSIFLASACTVAAQTTTPPQVNPPAHSPAQQKAAPATPPKVKTCAETAQCRILAESAAPPPSTPVVPNRSGSAAPGSKYALAVDQDSRVLLVLTSKGGKIQESELLGHEPGVPADFPFAASLPKDQALLTLLRLSCPERWRLWFALTVGLGEAVKPKLTLSNSVLVFREGRDASDRATLLTETFPEGTEVTVDDINADQSTEFVIQYFPKFKAGAPRSAGAAGKYSSLLKIWRVDGDGRLQPVSLDNVINDVPSTAAEAEMFLADYRHTADVIYTEQRVPIARGATVIRRNYDWDDAAKRYTLRDIVKTQEIAIK